MTTDPKQSTPEEARRVKIDVTADDIANGTRLNACQCPIARAATRAGLFAVEVYPSGGPDEFQPGHPSEIIFGTPRRSSRLPATAERFISAFDEGRTVEPFSFELEVTR
jgi:hypothetical protein